MKEKNTVDKTKRPLDMDPEEALETITKGFKRIVKKTSKMVEKFEDNFKRKIDGDPN